MAPSRLGGRPKIPWTASRKRKLARLYLMTDLKIQDIQQVLSENGFAPRTRSIQSQLSLLLPNNLTRWREYRPSRIGQGMHRLTQLKMCNEEQISKYRGRRRRTCKEPNTVGTPKSLNPSSAESSNPYYDANRHYEKATSVTTARLHCQDTFNSLIPTQPDSTGSSFLQQTNNMDVVESRISDKEVSHEIDEVAKASDMEHTNTASLEPPRSENEILQTSRVDNSVNVGTADFQQLGLKRSNSRVSSIGGASMRSLSSRVSSTLSLTLSHVQSVLSASNSWRSSLIYAMSLSSGRLSSTQDLPWTKDDFDSWNQLIDESMLSAGSIEHSDHEAKSLQTRPCCGLDKEGRDPKGGTVICDICGFADAHLLARSQLYPYPLKDFATEDRFGNSPLHHAAAAGCIFRVKEIISSVVISSSSELMHRNTSGETFLHVFRLRSTYHFRDYLDVLKMALEQDFNFKIRDYYGRSIPERLNELMDDWDIDPEYLREVSTILGVDASVDDNSRRVSKTTPIIKFLGSPESTAFEDSQPSRKRAGTGRKYILRFSKLKDALRKHKPQESQLNDSKVDILDDNGETHLMSALRRWAENPLSPIQLEELVKNSDIHMRDYRGYTALAIAARCGLREAVLTLLKHGANPNTRSYQKTSILAHAAAYLARAHKENNEPLYAQILSCIVLLTDYGAKAVVTVYDEFTVPSGIMPTQSQLKAKKKEPPQSASNRSVFCTPLDIIQEDSYEMAEDCVIAELEGDAPRLELSSESQIGPVRGNLKFADLENTNASVEPLPLRTWAQRDSVSSHEIPSRMDASSQRTNSVMSRSKLMESATHVSLPKRKPVDSTLLSHYETRYSPDDYLGIPKLSEVLVPKIVVTKHLDDGWRGENRNITENPSAQNYSNRMTEYIQPGGSLNINAKYHYDAPVQGNQALPMNHDSSSLSILGLICEEPMSLCEEPESWEWEMPSPLGTGLPPLSTPSFSPHWEPDRSAKYRDSNLNRHQNLHKQNGDMYKHRMHTCNYPGCGKRYSRSDALRVHERSKHSKKLELQTLSSSSGLFDLPESFSTIPVLFEEPEPQPESIDYESLNYSWPIDLGPHSTTESSYDLSNIKKQEGALAAIARSSVHLPEDANSHNLTSSRIISEDVDAVSVARSVHDERKSQTHSIDFPHRSRVTPPRRSNSSFTSRSYKPIKRSLQLITKSPLEEPSKEARKRSLFALQEPIQQRPVSIIQPDFTTLNPDFPTTDQISQGYFTRSSLSLSQPEYRPKTTTAETPDPILLNEGASSYLPCTDFHDLCPLIQLNSSGLGNSQARHPMRGSLSQDPDYERRLTKRQKTGKERLPSEYMGTSCNPWGLDVHPDISHINLSGSGAYFRLNMGNPFWDVMPNLRSSDWEPDIATEAENLYSGRSMSNTALSQNLVAITTGQESSNSSSSSLYVDNGGTGAINGPD